MTFAVGALLVAPLTNGCGVADSQPKGSHGGPIVLEIPIDQPWNEFATNLSGPLKVSDSLISIAACHNVAEWKSDRSLDLDIVISTDTRLLRVAQVVEDGRESPEMVKRMEGLRLKGHQVYDDSYKREGVTEAEFGDYQAIIDGSAPHGESYLVAYAVKVTVSFSVVVVLDTRDLKLASLAKYSGNEDSMTTMINGQQVSVDCSSLGVLG